VKASHGREKFIDVALAAVGRWGVFSEREDRRLTQMIDQLDLPAASRATNAANDTWRAIMRAARRKVEEIDDQRLWKLCWLVEQKLNRASTLVAVEVEEGAG
jgi:hypothetical protein